MELHSNKVLKEAALRSTTAPQFFENQLVDYKKASQYLGISESYLRRLKSQGKVPYVTIGQRGVRFRISSLNKWITEREIGR